MNQVQQREIGSAKMTSMNLSLEADFRAILRHSCRDAPCERWVDRLAIRTGAGPLWTDQFDDFVLHYPVLQYGESIPTHSARGQHALVSHMCLLVGAFTLDRLLDGQVSGGDAEEMSSELINTGFAQAYNLSQRSPSFSAWYQRRILDYKCSESGGYALPGSKHKFDPTHANRVASARGSFGLVTCMALAYAIDGCVSHLSKIEDAFDCVAIGLQYIDDVLDWREDFANQDENLMLSLLSDRADWWNDSEFSDEQVIELRLRDSELPDQCIETGIQWFDTAIELQREIGAETMCAELERKRNAVAAMRV